MPNNFIPYMAFMSISILMPIDMYYLLSRYFYACYICTVPLDCILWGIVKRQAAFP